MQKGTTKKITDKGILEKKNKKEGVQRVVFMAYLSGHKTVMDRVVACFSLTRFKNFT